MPDPNVTEKDVAELIEMTDLAAKAYIRGDMRTYFSLIRHEDDHVLFAPLGGEPRLGAHTSPERIEALEQFFRGGEAELEVVRVFASGGTWSFSRPSNASTARSAGCRTRTGPFG